MLRIWLNPKTLAGFWSAGVGVRRHMPYMRTWRWELAASAVQDIDANLKWVLGVLAKLDYDLYLLNAAHEQLLQKGPEARLEEWRGVLDATDLSYLWILGAYEAVRTLDQRFAALGASAVNRKQATGSLKHKFERLRVPLAKLEPSRRHKNTDYSFPRPGIADNRGIAWEVAPNEVVSRSNLSDEFLSLLERIQRGELSH